MGQQEVYDFLKNNPNSWYTGKEISAGLNMSYGCVTVSLKKLRHNKFIVCRPIVCEKNGKLENRYRFWGDWCF